MNNTTYINDINFFKDGLGWNRYRGKRILFVFGDSWTNNTYLINKENSYPYNTWSYKLSEKLNYDFVINISTNGGSNTDIFETCLNTMCLFEDYQFDKCKISELGAAEVKVIIGWSSQIRNFDATTKLFRPFNCSSLPYIDELDSTPFSKLYKTYITNLHPEYCSYSTQLQTICLQHYFKYHKIDSYYFMAFTPLLEKESYYTKWDLRSEIDSSRFYGLYSEMGDMGSKIDSLFNNSASNKFILDQPFFAEGFKRFFSNVFKSKSGFSEYLTNKMDVNNKNPYLESDGHPNELGLEVMANEIYQLINLEK